jgi:DNA-binding XRE family transcriptional regulator
MKIMRKEFDHKKFGEALFMARRTLKMTFAQAEAVSGVQRVTWHRVERGGQNVTLETALAMCRAVGMGLGDYLILEGL